MRAISQPSWLWDSDRARIVWANKAGIAYFGGETLFDLLDRPFERTEPGVENLTALSRRLKRGEFRKALLHFPSTGSATALSCHCGLHTLPDGRTGILVAGLAEVEGTASQSGELARAFSDLPFPALLLSQGTVVFANSAAERLFAPEQRRFAHRLLGGVEAAEEFQQRVTSAGTLGMTRRLDTLYGEREIRLTAKMLPAEKGADPAILLICEDVTDRRALERHLGGSAEAAAVPAAPPAGESMLSPQDAQTFEALGRSLRAEKQKSAEPVPVNVQVVPIRMPPGLPPVVTRKIDSFAHPVIIVQDGKIQYANPAALKLLRYNGVESLRDKIVFSGLPPRGTSTAKLVTGDGAAITVDLTILPIAWRSGPALQLTLAEIAPAVEVPAEPAPVAPSSSPKAEAPPSPRLAAVPPARPTIVAKPLRDEPKAELVIDLPREVPPSPLAAPAPEPAAAAPEPRKAEAPAPEPSPASQALSDEDEELRNILDTAADGIITLDQNGTIRSFSAGAEAIFGYRTAEIVDKPLATLLAPDSRRVLRDYLSALQGPGLAAVFNDGREVTAVVKQGGDVPLFLTIGRLHSTRENGAAFCVVLRDITQWKRTEAELRDAKDAAEQASRQKSEFLAKISHELRTPLNAILGFSEVMRMERFGEIKNDKYRGYVNDIHASGAHLLSLINDLLDLSKVEAGKLELNFTSVALTEVIDQAVKMVQEQATAGRVILRRTIPGDLPNVVADQRSMSQVMLNLLSNAIKFTDPGGQVIISAHLTKAGELKLRVKDTGLGMTEAEIKEALEPFRRITTDGRNVPGTGLGLPLTKALAEANRAQFEISSEPRKGTMVEITFPTTRVLAA
ncbi:PAS domain S-box protein [Nordella sp. HKS 07]|uniref:PAS domain S-box protein n=1 Tax=Nordella sp. HKS 07 TaxID=2712222 RepID=UPI0013E1A153|nr:PAS domain S-box protein [Nordella sp. HKS 07]QIG52113.1 PAS domain S-box protein [Nordella sp. HKS 07]